MATIKEIAQMAGVSIGTVDRVLHNRGMVNRKTKERVESVAKELNYHPNVAAQGLAVRKKKLRFTFFIIDTSMHPFFDQIYQAATEKAADLKQFGVSVDFFVLKMELGYLQTTAKELYKVLDRSDGIVMMGTDSPDMLFLLEEAKKRELPVVLYNTCFAEGDYLAYVGCDYISSGRLAAGLSALLGGEDARVCIYSEGIQEDSVGELQEFLKERCRDYREGMTGIASHDDRLLGFQQEMEQRYPAMELLDICRIHEDPMDNYLSAVGMLEQYPGVNIVYVINPRDYGICKAIAKADAKHQIRIITNDLVTEQRQMIEEGIISATICQEPEVQGGDSLEILFRYLAFDETPKQRNCYTNLSIHIAQNL
jgi:DNA-binding LacI/PurR family transcriptional regulator